MTILRRIKLLKEWFIMNIIILLVQLKFETGITQEIGFMWYYQDAKH